MRDFPWLFRGFSMTFQDFPWHLLFSMIIQVWNMVLLNSMTFQAQWSLWIMCGCDRSACRRWWWWRQSESARWSLSWWSWWWRGGGDHERRRRRPARLRRRWCSTTRRCRRSTRTCHGVPTTRRHVIDHTVRRHRAQLVIATRRLGSVQSTALSSAHHQLSARSMMQLFCRSDN